MKKYISLFLVLTAVASLCGCSSFRPAPQRYSKTLTEYFDTVTTVIAYDTSEAEFNRKAEELEQWLGEYDRLYDIYQPYDGINNLYTVNEQAGKAPVKVDRKVLDLLLYGKEAYTLSRGTVNICLGSVLRLWHEAREASLENPESAYLPEQAALTQASAHTDIQQLILDEQASTVYLADSEMSLDVGAVAKGFAARALSERIQENLWQDFVLSLGGNVCTAGNKNGDGTTLWNVQIENPNPQAGSALEVLQLTDKAVVTSGDYQRYFTVDGMQYCHIIAPDTLYPADAFSGVTVVCEDSALGDVLSTALFILSLDQGKELVEALDGVEALWVDKAYNIIYSSHFEDYLK